MSGRRWQGSFTDGRTAALREVVAVFDGQFLLIQESGGLEVTRWDVRQVRTEPGGRPGSVELRLEEEPEASLLLEGPDLASDLRAIGVGIPALSESGSRRVIVGLGLLAGIVGAAGLVWFSVSPLSRLIAGWVPLEYERAISGQVEEAFADYHCESDEAAALIEGLVVRLAGPDHDLPTVHVVNLELPNAFAMPGGGIVFTRGLLETAESPDEVAGILAHEIQHVEQRHVMTSIVRGALLSAVWAVTIGDYSGVLVIDPTTAFHVATMRFSRDDEADADAGAVAMLDRAGIRRDGLSAFFARLAEEEGDLPEWLSTHPASGQRADATRAEGLADPSDRAASLDQAEWAIVSGACEGTNVPEMDLQELFF